MHSSSTSSFLHQKSFQEESGKKKALFPNCHWISKKDEKRGHKRNNTPCKRWGHSVILFENQMFLFGGSGNNNNARNWETIYILNCDTYDWEKVCPNDALGTNTPEPRDSHACVRIGNNMYIFGGSNGENPLNDMFAFNLVSKTWNKIDTTGETPSPREGHSGVALHDRYFFIFGGWDGKNIFQNCYLFDYITKKWKMIEYIPGSEPLPRESHSCALLQDNIYIFGGQGTSIKKKDTYYNDLFRFKINIDKSLERVSGVWTKLSSKNGLQPAPRTSHSIAPYKDRYLIVIGGEGYSSNNEGANMEEPILEAKENGKSETHEVNNEENDDDDDHPPCFPKSDIWIYDIEEETWNLLEIKSSDIFLPRFTHSCAVYKDSLIIFGGLKDFKNSIDDLMVLMLEDNESKKPIHLCSCCKKMLDSEHNEEIHQVDTDKIGSELKKVDITFDELENEFLEYTTNTKPFISLSYLPNVVNLIKWPFSSFGIFIDNAFLIESKEIHIRWEKKYRYGYNPNKVVIKDPMHIENFLVLEFNGGNEKNINEIYNENFFMEEQTNLFYKNLKYAGLRLGETIFYVKKREDIIELYYISTNLKNNPDLNDFIIFSCCWNIVTHNELSPTFTQNKKSIMDNISHILTEEEVMQLPSKNTLFILNLRKLNLKNKRVFEMTMKNDDICLNVPKILESTKSGPINYSLKKYLEHFFLLPPKNMFEIYLNKKKIEFSENFIIKKKFQALENPKSLTPFSKNMRIFCQMVEEDKKETKSFENEEKNNSEQVAGEPKNEIPEKDKPKFESQGILLYQNNRLVQNLDDVKISNVNNGKQSNLVILGYIELESSILLDFSKSVIINFSKQLRLLKIIYFFFLEY